MMNGFDKQLRDKLYNCEAPVDADIWSCIQSRMASRARARVIRKVCLFTSAAAACLVAGLLIFSPSDIESGIQSHNTLSADNSAVSGIQIPQSNSIGSPAVIAPSHSSEDRVISPFASNDDSEEILPMSEQVKSLEGVSAELIIPTENTSSNDQQEIQEASAEVQRSLPLGFWDDDELVTKPKRQRSEISISSNFASSSTSRGYGNAPMYTPSKLGENAAQTIPTPITGDTKYYMPLAFGLQIKIPLAGQLSLGTGLNYTYIVTRYDSTIASKIFENTYNQLHYIGLPINLYYEWKVGNSDMVNMYAFAGGAVEKCVDSRYVFGSNVVHDAVAGFQHSVNAGFGVEYWFVPRMGIYFDPSIAYYFKNNQPTNIRTDQPLQMHAEVGLRFKL